MCNCEHISHFPLDEVIGFTISDWSLAGTGHAYCADMPSERNASAIYVGKVCDECAATCMRDYLEA